VPIIIDGGFTTPDIAEQALADGKTDYIGLGRPILADPDWVKKLREKRPEDIVPCIRCVMGCVGTPETYSSAAEMRCAVNPLCNLTSYREIAPLVKKKRVLAGGYDAVIVATGTTPIKSRVIGSDKPHVCSVMEFTGDRNIELGQTVLMIGGGLVGAEIAYSQAKKGKKAILTTRRTSMFEVANDNSSPMQQRLMMKLKEYSVDIKLGLDLKEITDDGAVFAGADKAMTEIKCDNIVLCRGYVRNNKLYKDIGGAGRGSVQNWRLR